MASDRYMYNHFLLLLLLNTAGINLGWIFLWFASYVNPNASQMGDSIVK